MGRPDIVAMFHEINAEHFNGEIPDTVEVSWNSRLRTTAGYARFRWINRREGIIHPTSVELSEKLFQSLGWPLDKIRETLIHEMTHAWLFHVYNDRGHGPRFQRKMDSIVGYRDSHRCHTYDTSKVRNNRTVVITCLECGWTGNQARMPKRPLGWTHKGCGGVLTFEKTQAYDPTSISIFGHNPEPPRVAASSPRKDTAAKPKKKLNSVSIFDD